jgi:hypothetical protein
MVCGSAINCSLPSYVFLFTFIIKNACGVSKKQRQLQLQMFWV